MELVVETKRKKAVQPRPADTALLLAKAPAIHPPQRTLGHLIKWGKANLQLVHVIQVSDLVGQDLS